VHYQLSKAGIGDILRAFERGGGNAFEPTSGSDDWLAESLDRVRSLVGLEDTASGQPAFDFWNPAVNRILTVLVIGVAVVGLASLIRRNRAVAFMLALPPLLAVIAASLGQYPLVGRTLLFALPSIAICVGEGAGLLFAASGTTRRAPLAVLAAVCLAAIAYLPATHVLGPRGSGDMRAALGYLGANTAPGDVLYVSPGAQYTFAYYHLCGCATFDPATRWPFRVRVEAGDPVAVEPLSPDLVVGADDSGADVAALQGRERAWLVLAELWDEDRVEIVEHLGGLEAVRQRLETDGPLPARTSVVLLDLSPR
jgi:hypothetical protein